MILGKDLNSVTIFIVGIILSTLLAWLYAKIKQKIHIPLFFKIISYFIIAYPFSYIVGNRYLTVGADTINYFHQFTQSINYGESSYELLKGIIQICGGTYTILFWIYAVITMIGIMLVFDIVEQDINLPLFMFVFLCFFGLNMTDQMRQIAALPYTLISICLFSKNRKKLAVVFMIISILIHTSSLFAFIILLLVTLMKDSNTWYIKMPKKQIEVKIRAWIIIFLLIIFAFAGYRFVFPIFEKVVPLRYVQYFTTRVDRKSVGIGWLFDISPVIILMFNKGSQNYSNGEKLLYIYSLMAIPIRLMGYISMFLSRLSYINVFVALYLLCNKNKTWKSKLILILVACLYFFIFYVLWDMHDVFPYISIKER